MMKSFLHLFVAVALLLQGVPAAIASVQDSMPEQVMPCHPAMDAAERSTDAKPACCDCVDHGCNAICAAPALPARSSAVAPSTAALSLVPAPRHAVLAAHRAPPLRPPSPLFA
jgi:hypothetical protein